MSSLPPAVSATDAFMKAYDECADALFRHCYFRVYDRERAKDVLQECFTRTWEYIAQGKKIDNMRAFLYRVANNLIIDASRRQKESSLEELAEVAGFEPEAHDQDHMLDRLDGARILEHVHLLDARHRDVIVMRFVDGFGPSEIAEILDESENVVSVRLHRAIKIVKSHFVKKESAGEPTT